jgi:hypothetical protein
MTKKEAVKIVDESIHLHPEIKANERKRIVIEDKHSVASGYHFCRECSTWTPKEPPTIKALDKEWTRIFDREVERVRKTKTAA